MLRKRGDKMLDTNKIIANIKTLLASQPIYSLPKLYSQIVEIVCNLYDIESKDLLSHTRRREIAEARHIAIKLCSLMGATSATLGRHFQRNRSTIWNSLRRAEELIEIDNRHKVLYNQIYQEIYKDLECAKDVDN